MTYSPSGSHATSPKKLPDFLFDLVIKPKDKLSMGDSNKHTVAKTHNFITN